MKPIPTIQPFSLPLSVALAWNLLEKWLFHNNFHSLRRLNRSSATITLALFPQRRGADDGDD